MKHYTTIFEEFNNLHILVIGDVMLDAYTFGEVTRISPEAPVPIVNVTSLENRLGGAANVALNLRSLGAKVTIAAIIGNDIAGNNIKKLLSDSEINTNGIIDFSTRKTTIKNRVIANKHQLLRLDTETIDDMNEAETILFTSKIKAILLEEKIDAVVFEDYDKGALNASVISSILAITNEKNIPTTVDPKKKNFENYSGATLFKPNLRELSEGINYIGSKLNLINELDKIGMQYCIENRYKYLFTTLSEHGVFICDSKNAYNEDAHLRSIADVSGAGDTVIAVATLCLALNLPMQEIAKLSNIAGGLVCEKLGVVPIDKNELLTEVQKTISKLN